MKDCDNCLFYVDAMPRIVICVGQKHTKRYARKKKNCVHWVENTFDNAVKWLLKNEE